MNNPYQTLGIEATATDDEVKKAYRKLSRIYHPDANINNPNKDQAEAKFKEVQAAYDQIINEREHGYSSNTYGSYGSAGGYGSAGSSNPYGQRTYQGNSSDDVEMQAVYNFINNRSYEDALNVLNRMSNRSARWYYLSAIANAGLGNNVNALQFAKQAVDMEPDNAEYNNLLQRLQMGGQWYQSMGNTYGRTFEGGGNYCVSLLCANLLCNCCCMRPF